MYYLKNNNSVKPPVMKVETNPIENNIAGFFTVTFPKCRYVIKCFYTLKVSQLIML
jgi:hypothetical protein